MKWIVRLGAVACLLAFAHRLAVRGSELVDTAGRLESRRSEVARREGDLSDLEEQLDRLDERLANLDRHVTEVEQRHGGTIPGAEYEDYRRLIDERNEVASERNTVLAYQLRVRRDYEDEVDRHNADVERANVQARGTAPLAVLATLWRELTRQAE